MISKSNLVSKYAAAAAVDVVDQPGGYAIRAAFDAGYDEEFESRSALVRAVLRELHEIEQADAFCYGLADEASPAQRRRLSRVLRDLGNSEEAISAAWAANDFSVLRCF